MAAVRTKLENERQLAEFLATFGATGLALRDTRSEEEAKTPQAFWHMDEGSFLQLFALAAQSLAGKKPFQDHPANRDVPPESLPSRVTIVTDVLAQGSASAARAAALVRRLDRPDWPVSLGRLRTLQPERRQTKSRGHSPVRAERGGLDDVFRGFTWETGVQPCKTGESLVSVG